MRTISSTRTHTHIQTNKYTHTCKNACRCFQMSLPSVRLTREMLRTDRRLSQIRWVQVEPAVHGIRTIACDKFFTRCTPTWAKQPSWTGSKQCSKLITHDGEQWWLMMFDDVYNNGWSMLVLVCKSQVTIVNNQPLQNAYLVSLTAVYQNGRWRLIILLLYS